MSPESYIGSISQFGGNFAPRQWATCDGQIMTIQHNEALFSIIGTTYGGDGIRTFALPKMNNYTEYNDKPIWCICVEGVYPPRD